MLGCYKQANDLMLKNKGADGSNEQQIRDYIHRCITSIKLVSNPVDYIAINAAKAPITMINEAHDFPAHRAFVMALLPKLKAAGYKYLAMETLSQPDDKGKNYLTSITQRTGYYTSEPVFGELTRYALELGYTLIPYEYISPAYPNTNMADTALVAQLMHERDSMQAVNLLKAMHGHKDGKILVLGGYAHTFEAWEKTLYWNPFHPMGLYFKELSGINPFTINQIQFSEMNEGRMSRNTYNQLCMEGKIQEDVCTQIGDTILVGKAVQNDLSDIYTLLPKTTYLNGRPTWLTLNSLRKRYEYSFPKKVMNNLVLVQAYYLNEIPDENLINQKVPADQFMLLENNHADFYLRPNFDYLIVCRDVNNNIIYKKPFYAK